MLLNALLQKVHRMVSDDLLVALWIYSRYWDLVGLVFSGDIW